MLVGQAPCSEKNRAGLTKFRHLDQIGIGVDNLPISKEIAFDLSFPQPFHGAHSFGLSICGCGPPELRVSPVNLAKGLPMNTTSVSASAAIPVPDFQVFDAGNVLFQSGRTFRTMTVAYKTFGLLIADKSNVIVYPTSYSAQP